MVFPDARILSKAMQARDKPKLTPTLWKQAQIEDPDIGPVINLLKNKQLPQYKAKEGDPSAMRVLLKYHQDLCLKHDLLYHQVQLKDHQLGIQQFILLEPFQKQVILACNDDFGHFRMEKTLGLLKDQFFWPKMSEDVRLHIHPCDQCTKFKQLQEREEMKSIICTYPLELVHLDFLTIGKEGSDKNVNMIGTMYPNIPSFSAKYI